MRRSAAAPQKPKSEGFKPDAETAFAKLSSTDPLADDKLERHRTTVRQDQMDQIDLPGTDEISGWTIEEALVAAGVSASRAKELGRRTAQSKVIERLAKNHAISSWVKEGVELHTKHSSEHCEFCLQPLSPERLKALADHFSFEDQDLKEEIEGDLTHNFEFLRLLINWLNNSKPRTDRKTYTMVLCSETEDGRSARLAPLDKLHIDHTTEYHYLFKVLYSFKSDGTILGCYHVPNIARKVLETFLDFHVPSNKSMYAKLEETSYDPHKKTAIYKFANDLSHHTGKSFDPALVSEAQKNTTYLLEMIADVAPLHYAGLKALCEV